jgi:hypothetical protein
MRLSRIAFAVWLVSVPPPGPLAESPYVDDQSIGGRAAATKPGCPDDPLQYLPIACWAGQRVVFLPQPLELQRFGYQSVHRAGASITDHPSYKDLVGKVARLSAVRTTNEDLGFKEAVLELDDGAALTAEIYGDSINGIGFLRDIDAARAAWSGKTLWYKEGSLATYDAESGKTGTFSTPRYSPVSVLRVTAGWYEHAPVRFVVRDAKGAEGFVDCTLSGTNVAEILRDNEVFADKFETKDPRKGRGWTDKVWGAIADGKVFVGMTAEQAKMAWGKPKSVNRTMHAGRTIEQWVYGESYLYLEGGTVTTIQN